MPKGVREPWPVRLMRHLDMRGPLHPYDPALGSCWVWARPLTPQGYGYLRVLRKQVPTHRLSYELHVGPIPDGLDILHSCDNRACGNPAHLRPGTVRDNSLDMMSRGRGRGQFVCPRGEANGRAKLTAALVAEIRRLAPSTSQSVLAREFSVSPAQIHNIVHGLQWKGV